jgi:acetyl esterase/lipase
MPLYIQNKYLSSFSKLLFFIGIIQCVNAQTPARIRSIFPTGTITRSNIPYANDSLDKHLLDIYLPANAGNNTPLIVWIHGGAWMLNDKYADMSYMKNTIKGIIDSGYALASINYRYSTEAVFPAQIHDCNQAFEFLYQHAGEYKLDKNRIAVIGFSAGGHLASLLALSNNNRVSEFYPNGSKSHFNVKCVLDYYGPSDFVVLAGSPDTSINNSRNPVAILLGALPIDRPDLAKRASPVTYVDKNDPPFLIVQGEKDESVPNTQSKLLSSWLTIAGVKNELIVVPDAPHYGEMFDAEDIRKRVFSFLSLHLKK